MAKKLNQVIAIEKGVKNRALPAKRVNDLLTRVEKLQEAVKFAREEANNMEVEDVKIGEAILSYLFA